MQPLVPIISFGLMTALKTIGMLLVYLHNAFGGVALAVADLMPFFPDLAMFVSIT